MKKTALAVALAFAATGRALKINSARYKRLIA